MPAPQVLLDLVNSLRLEGVPSSAAPGDRIAPRLVPTLAPLTPALPNPDLAALARAEPLARIVADIDPVLAYLEQVLSVDVAAVLKAVEFNRPAEQQAAAVDVASQAVRDLGHLIPTGVGVNLALSQLVEGLIGRARATLDHQPGELPAEFTALITKPAALAAVPTAAVAFRVTDAAGNPLVVGTDYFTVAPTPFVPEFVFLPVVVNPEASPPSSIRFNFYCDVTVTYTPVGGASESLSRTVGPASLDLVTTAVPVMVVLTEHAIGDARFPGRVLLGVPANSSLGDVGTAFGSLAQIRTALSNITTVLGLIGIPVPATITAALGAVGTVTALPVGRFRKDDLIGFFEWTLGIPPWDDWQGIFSAAFVFGSPGARRAYFGGRPASVLVGFFLDPSNLGVGAIPDLSMFPLAPSVGTATQLFPPPPTAPPGGSFNDVLTSLNFP
jgi:hypothetical protein